MEYCKEIQELIEFAKLENLDEENIDYTSLGLSIEFEDELINLATNHKYLASEDEDEYNIVVHAINALMQFHSSKGFDAIADLILDFEDDMSLTEGIIEYMIEIEEKSFEGTKRILNNEGLFTSSMKLTFLNGLSDIAQKSDKHNDDLVKITLESLEHNIEKDAGFNGFAVMVLRYAGGIKNIDIIRDVFKKYDVDVHVIGDLEDIEIEFGLRTKRVTKRAKMFPDLMNMFEEKAKTIQYNEPKVGRNDPCPCGSGKKYKKCCL